MNKSNYEVIIVGGGAVGIALALELALHNISTLVLERYEHPLKTPRAQSLNARTMEFFMRWGIDERLKERILLPADFSLACVWCSLLTQEEDYFIGYWGDHQLPPGSSPQRGIRIPQWVTEEVLRARLADFPCIDFLKHHEVQDIAVLEDTVVVQAFDKMNGAINHYHAPYLACCDGVQGISKKKLNNPFVKLSEKSRMITINFSSKDIMTKKKVPDGIFYCVLSDTTTSFWGPIALDEGLWFAQMVWNEGIISPTQLQLSEVLDRIFGIPFDKNIIDYQFWDMQVQLADKFSVDNRVFWLGDAAHAFAPTGGLGLNTGFGDAVNLGWKLAMAIKKLGSVDLLSTYETERRPVCVNNLNFAKQMATEALTIKQNYPPAVDYKAFISANRRLGERYLKSSGLTMGYAYHDSFLTQGAHQPKTDENFNPFQYQPTVEPGYFLPHINCEDNTSIYTKLSSTCWNLIICGKEKLEGIHLSTLYPFFKLSQTHVVEVETGAYPYLYLYVRPDWHIAFVSNG